MNNTSFISLHRLTAKILGSTILLCMAVSVIAQNDNPTGKSGVFNGNSETAGSYDPYTANATRTVVDLTVPGTVGSYPLQWTRTMNSRRTEGPSYGFGSGGAWQHSHGWGIDFAPRPRAERHTPTPKSYIVYYPDGRRVDFQRRQSAPIDTAWRGPAGVTDRFQPVAASGLCYLILSDGGQVEFSQVGTFDQDIGWEFELHGPTRIIDPHGQATTFSYTNGLLTQITEPAGRWLRISYITPFGLQVIGGVQAGYSSNTVTQSVTYSYQQFSTGGFNYTTLTGVAYSDGTSAIYTYQMSNTYPNTGPPLIQTCDDVRYAGPMKKIAYDFYTEPSEANGGIYGEFAVARKWLYPAPSVVSYLLDIHRETRADGPGRTFWYGANGGNPPTHLIPQPYLLSAVSDFKGQKAYFGYDANTYLTNMQDANGNETIFTRTSLTGKILTITHPPDQAGVSSTRRFFYTNPNTAYYVDHVTDELGNTTVYQRDEKFRIKTINYPDTATEEFTYNNFGQVMTCKMTSGGTEGFEYDGRGRLERYRDPYHDSTNKTGKPTAWYQYDPLDRVSGVTGWRGTGPGDLNYTTNYAYNHRGQLTRVTHPIDPITGVRYFSENTYNNDSTLATTKNERGSTTTYGYDDYKRLSSITAPIAFVGDTTPRVTYLYYSKDGTATIDYRFTASAVANVTTPSGNTEKTLYDSNFWKSSVTVGSGAEAMTTSYTYDSVGNLKTVTQPNSANVGDGPTHKYFYDKRNRLTDVDDAYHHQNHLGHTISWTYDQAGNKKSQLRANNQLVTYDQYDPMHRLEIETVQRDIGISDRTIMTYDLAGNLTTFTDGRQKQYTYTYDFLNRKRTAVYPRDDSGVMRQEQYHYDLANNMDTYTNRAGAVQTFTYDNRNRSTYFSWSDGTPARSTSYDQVGNIVKMTPTGNDFVYDLRNRLTSDIQSVAALGISRHVDYSYDADSNRKTVTYPSGMTFTYNYNSRNQLKNKSDVSGAVVSYTYDLNGNRKTRTLRNGTTSEYFWNELDQLSILEHWRQGLQFAKFDYGHDVVGRIFWVGRDYSESEGFHGGEVYDYYLDDQLKSAKFDAVLINDPNPRNATSFAYDSSGNRTTVSSRSTPSYTYTANDLNQYNSVNGSVPGYDTKGNLTNYNGWSYQYNGQNQLTVAENGSNVFNFYYDGMGRQTLRYDNGSWIYSVWDGWNLVEEYDEQNVLLHSYVRGAGSDEMVVRFNGGPTIWYYQDAQGSTTHLADDSGNVIERYKYDPALSGAPYIYNANGQQISASAFDNRFLYTGRDWIKELGLYDYRHRFYLPSLGRFLQPDPIGFDGGDANLYRYCGNDAVNRTDPDGLIWISTYSGSLFNPFGHIGIGYSAGATYGFYPGQYQTVFGHGSPGNFYGMIQRDNPKDLESTFYISTDPKQDKAIMDALKAWNGKLYNYVFQNCANAVAAALQAGGIKANGNQFPRQLLRNLKQQYGQGGSSGGYGFVSVSGNGGFDYSGYSLFDAVAGAITALNAYGRSHGPGIGIVTVTDSRGNSGIIAAGAVGGFGPYGSATPHAAAWEASWGFFASGFPGTGTKYPAGQDLN